MTSCACIARPPIRPHRLIVSQNERSALSSPKVPRIDLFPRSVPLKNGDDHALDVGPSRHEEARSETRMTGPPCEPSVPVSLFPTLLLKTTSALLACARYLLRSSRHHRAHELPPRRPRHLALLPNVLQTATLDGAGSLRPRGGIVPPRCPASRHLPTRHCTWRRGDQEGVRVDRTPVTVLIDQPSTWSQTLDHALDSRLLLAREPERRRTLTNQIERARAEHVPRSFRMLC